MFLFAVTIYHHCDAYTSMLGFGIYSSVSLPIYVMRGALSRLLGFILAFARGTKALARVFGGNLVICVASRHNRDLEST